MSRENDGMKELVRVGEGHYTDGDFVPAAHREAVEHVLQQMRQVTQIYRQEGRIIGWVPLRTYKE